MKSLKSLTVIIILFFFFACNTNRIADDYQSMSDLRWSKANKLSFIVEIEDTAVSYNTLIGVRHAEGYPYQNLKVTLKTISPSGKIETQNIDLHLAEKNGDWKGSGMGDMWDTEIPVTQNISYTEKGSYTFELEHNMPTDPLPLIMEMGIIIEKAQ